MIGGSGHDTYWVDDLADVIVERRNEGADAVFVSLDRYVLPKHVEVINYDGTGDFEGVGNRSDNQILGGSGDDTLIGGGGENILIGAGGDDLYIVNRNDRLIEEVDGGRDRVHLTGGYFNDYHMDDNIEVVINKSKSFARVYGNASDNLIVGRRGNDDFHGAEGNDRLIGGKGGDDLDGGAGHDWLLGGEGDDTLLGGKGDEYMDAGADVVDGGKGFDTLDYRGSQVRIVIDLNREVQAGGDAKGDQLHSVERIFASHFNDRLTGSDAREELHGFDGDDRIQGGGGRDTLHGGEGDDRLSGGKGADLFVFGATYTEVSHTSHLSIGVDRITDFAAGDRIDTRKVDASEWGLVGAYQPFVWIGEAAFSGTGAELRFEHRDGQTIILGDVDNNRNGDAEFSIVLDGIHDLSAGDFLLG